MECKKCGVIIDISYGSGLFCGSKCSRSYSNSRCDDDLLKDAICYKCGSAHMIKKRASEKLTMCSNCKDSTIKKRYYVTKKRKVKVMVKLYCEHCGNERSRYSKRCCSNKCDAVLKRIEKFANIEMTNGVGHECRSLKKYLIEKRGHHCCICNYSIWNNKPILLIMDHINGRASDNRLENLRLVCGNCDAQLPTYKSKNKNSDRKRIGKYL